jgi:hypothetical protein
MCKKVVVLVCTVCCHPTDKTTATTREGAQTTTISSPHRGNAPVSSSFVCLSPKRNGNRHPLLHQSPKRKNHHHQQPLYAQQQRQAPTGVWLPGPGPDPYVRSWSRLTLLFIFPFLKKIEKSTKRENLRSLFRVWVDSFSFSQVV